MSFFKKSMIFVTFFGSCAAVALLVASLGTRKWANAAAKRTLNPHESNGRISFGLFAGKKELNVAYGWRSYDIDVLHMLKYEPEFLVYGYWLGAVVCVCGALLSSTICTVLAAVNTAMRSSCLSGMKGLWTWNILAFLSSLGAVGFWIGQFYSKIQYNVLSLEDLDNNWTSEGMAELGYSFWFVVGAATVHFVHLLILYLAGSNKKTDIIPMIEEKTNGAIMLY